MKFLRDLAEESIRDRMHYPMTFVTGYYVSPDQCTDIELYPGWYVIDESGQPVEVSEVIA